VGARGKERLRFSSRVFRPRDAALRGLPDAAVELQIGQGHTQFLQ
jgi:hypothetical protein